MSEPKIVLLSFTPHPIEVMLFAAKNMHGKVPNSLEEFMAVDIPDRVKFDFMSYLAAEPLTGGVQEFVSTVWLLKNVSRAFQQQLTRHRSAAYSIQSLRIVPKEHFADDDAYHTPSNVKDSVRFGLSMDRIQNLYMMMLRNGENPEVARGILPLNIHSPITMSISLRHLTGLINARLCHMAQGEFQEVAKLMVGEVVGKMGKYFEVLFRPPCEDNRTCPHADGCGRYPRSEWCEACKRTEQLDKFLRS